MFLVLVKVSPIMSLSYVESLGPKKDCKCNSREIVSLSPVLAYPLSGNS